MKFIKGQFVESDGLLAVAVSAEGDPDVPENHVALWFGEPQLERKTKGGIGGHKPKVHTVPIDLCEKSQESEVSH